MNSPSICFISSEVYPFAKTGGLADVSGALPKYLAAAGCDVRTFMPLYSTIDRNAYGIHPVEFIRDAPIEMGEESIPFSLYTTRIPGSSATLYLVDAPRFYARGKVYTDDPDEGLRFAFLCRAVIECCQRMGWGPSIFHCHDWQTALVPFYLQTVYNWDRLFTSSRTILTIHNIAYQGLFPLSLLPSLGLEKYADRLDHGDVRAGMVNFLKTGILYADIITTVSNTYAREIQTPEYGAGLEHLLSMRSQSLFGIVNGVDYHEWSPEHDELIPHPYSVDDLIGKEENKKALLEALNLAYDPNAPVLGIISRLTGQKGFDLFFEMLVPFLRSHDVRLAILGTGEPKYETFFSRLELEFPEKVCFYRGFQTQLSHMIEAGSDIFLMPSHFEPCGLNQIYSLRYGTIPVVRRTGGLADTVQPWNPLTGTGTGFVFDHYDATGLNWAMEAAVNTYYDREAWDRLMENAMIQNYSWEKQVREYLALYSAILGA